MKFCLYCQTPIQSDVSSLSLQQGALASTAAPITFVAAATDTEQFCCRSCELIWNWTHGNQILAQDLQRLNTEDFDYLAHEEIEKKFHIEKDRRLFKFHIEGLNCVSCVHLLEELPQIIKGVLTSRLDFSESTLVVELAPFVYLPLFCAQLVDLGYKPTLLQSDDQLQNIQKIENRKELMKLAIAGAVAGNIMLFTVPLYGGLVGLTGTLFKWISFILFLPLVFYSSQTFYKNALVSLQKRMINVDVTIVIALWLGFILSTWNLINNREELYFDSTASFIFLILCSRFYMKRIQQKFLVKKILSHLFQKEIYFNRTKGHKVSADQIVEGDIISIKRGQLVPSDGKLISESAEFDLSYLTGESWPEKVEKNFEVFAGARLLSDEIVVQMVKKSNQSHLGQLVSKIESISSVSDQYKTETDYAAHWLTIIVLMVSGLFFIVYSQTNTWMAFQRSLALLIVACPCAIAFGTPLALSLGTKKAYQNGFFIRSESFFERLLSVKNIILDKTGTLTESKLNLVRTFPPQIDSQMRSLILAAESQSRHPIAQSLKKEWQTLSIEKETSSTDEVIQLVEVKNIPGLGVHATYRNTNGDHVITVQKAKHSDDVSGMIEVVVSIDSAPKAYLYFEEKIREKTSSFVEKLYQKNFNVFILTGDLKNRALEFSKKFKIPSFRVFSEQTPEMKEEIIKNHAPCLYIGDGLNDLLALKAAHVSYAVEGQFDVTLSVADVYAPQKGPEGILYLLGISKKIQSTIHGNLFFALLYNLIAGGMALTGMMSPLLAAILMPISSTIILSHTMWRLR